jgi:hypothetical protein
MNATQRHQRAVAQSFRFAQEAADRGALGEALEWLTVVDYVDDGLPAEWERARACWQAKWAARDERQGPLSTRLEDARASGGRP